MTDSLQPKPEHIERLMQNPSEFALFDQIYGDGASLQYLQADQVKAAQEKPNKEEEKENQEPEKVSGFTGNILPGIQKGGKEFFETAQGLSDLLKEQFPGLNYSVRIKDNPDSIFFNDERIFLIRCFWTILDRTENSEPILQPLLGGVLAVEFQFWSHVSSSWLPDPPFMGIPKAIEMNILFENDELQSHIFKIL